MAQAQAAPRQEAAPLPDGEPKPRKKRTLLYAMIAVLLLGGAGGGAWFFMQGGDAADEPKPVVETPPVFFPLETFTVNLVPEYGDQYLQVEMTVKAVDQKTIDLIKARMPEVRNRVLLLLSSMRASQLTPVTGKRRLAEAVRAEINGLIDPKPQPVQKIERIEPAADGASAETAPAQPAAPAPESTGAVREILFTSFIIQ
jgi:flagellar protein FliL